MGWGTATVNEKRQHIAALLWLSPDHPDTWPDWLIDRLVALREDRGEGALLRELALLMMPPTPVSMR